MYPMPSAFGLGSTARFKLALVRFLPQLQLEPLTNRQVMSIITQSRLRGGSEEPKGLLTAFEQMDLLSKQDSTKELEFDEISGKQPSSLNAHKKIPKKTDRKSKGGPPGLHASVPHISHSFVKAKNPASMMPVDSPKKETEKVHGLSFLENCVVTASQAREIVSKGPTRAEPHAKWGPVTANAPPPAKAISIVLKSTKPEPSAAEQFPSLATANKESSFPSLSSANNKGSRQNSNRGGSGNQGARNGNSQVRELNPTPNNQGNRRGGGNQRQRNRGQALNVELGFYSTAQPSAPTADTRRSDSTNWRGDAQRDGGRRDGGRDGNRDGGRRDGGRGDRRDRSRRDVYAPYFNLTIGMSAKQKHRMALKMARFCKER
jgi:hypothetical protein